MGISLRGRSYREILDLNEIKRVRDSKQQGRR